MSKYGVFSGPNAGKNGPEKNSVPGHFLCSVAMAYYTKSWSFKKLCKVFKAESFYKNKKNKKKQKNKIKNDLQKCIM